MDGDAKGKDKKPTFDNLPDSVGVSPSISIGTVIFTVSATDPNGDTITFNIQPPSVPFDIDPNSKFLICINASKDPRLLAVWHRACISNPIAACIHHMSYFECIWYIYHHTTQLAFSVSFEYLCYGSTAIIISYYSFSAAIYFRRQNLTSKDVRF